MLLTNRLFFEQVEAMLAEGHEVQIRMKGHSMRPLLRNERDIAVLTPIAKYAPAPVPAAGAPADPVPETRAADGNASHATQHWLTQIMAALAPEPTSRRMAAMAATQGVYKSVNTRKLTAAVVDRSVVTPAPPSRI